MSTATMAETMAQTVKEIKLPTPHLHGKLSLEQALSRRRSVRAYGDGAISLQQVSQLLWAAQGITSPNGYRTAPSAGALYPLDIYLVSGKISGLTPGVYHYRPHQHKLELKAKGDRRGKLAIAAWNQSSVRKAPMLLVVTASYQRTTQKYGRRGRRYTHIEAGHAAQNVLLQAVSLKLSGVVIGAFDDHGVIEIIHAPSTSTPMVMLPIGKQK